MNNALIVSYSEKSIAELTEVLSEVSVCQTASVASAGEARRLLIEQDFDLCIINAPLPDEPGESLAKSFAEHANCQVILLVKNEIYDEISYKVEDYGVLTVAKPINKTIFWSAVKMAQATHKRMRAMQDENKKLLQKIEDIRIIDRGKCLLIAIFSMSETEAHRYIEKQAMDMRLTRREVAENIIKTYDN